MPEELVRLIETHPDILSARESLKAAEEGVNRALTGFYPSIVLRGEAGPEWTESKRTGKADLFRRQGSLTLGQNLFDGLRTSSRVKSAQFSLEAAGYILDATTQELIYQGVTQYLDVLLQAELVAIARETVETVRRQLALEDERVQKGAGIELDVIFSKSRLQIAKERLAVFEGAADESVDRYIQLFDIVPDKEQMSMPEIPPALMPGDVNSAIASARENNPGLLAGQAQIGIAEQAKESIRGNYFPSFDVTSRLNIEEDISGLEGLRKNAFVGLSASWDLSSAYTNRSAVAESAFQAAAARQEYRATLRRVIEETRLSWDNHQTAVEREALLDNGVNIAQAAFDARRRLREAGRETVINVLDAENEVANARINHASARNQVRISLYRLLLSMGRLNAATLELPSSPAP